jgi:hypothetical protein
MYYHTDGLWVVLQLIVKRKSDGMVKRGIAFKSRHDVQELAAQ